MSDDVFVRIEGRVEWEDFINEDEEWECTKCSACCRSISKILPEFDRGDGVCKNLTSENLCGIYNKRPEVCRFDNWPMSDKGKAGCCAILFNQIWGDH